MPAGASAASPARTRRGARRVDGAKRGRAAKALLPAIVALVRAVKAIVIGVLLRKVGPERLITQIAELGGTAVTLLSTRGKILTAQV
jgi:hypothetical protein